MRVKVFQFLMPLLFGLLTASYCFVKLKATPSNLRTKAATSPTKPALIFEETFETQHPFSSLLMDHIGNWDYALQYVDSPVFQGKRAARFEIREDQPLVKRGKRAEVVIIKGKNLPGKDMWYSFAVYFPTVGYEYDSEREIFTQWYQGGTPATSLRTQKDKFLLESGNTKDELKRFDLGPITKDTWHEFVVHFIHSYGPDGFIEIWHNGTKVLTHAGGNMYNDVMPKWKIGPYKAAFKHGTSMVNRRIIYFDNVRVGDSDASFDDMSSHVFTR